MDTDKPIGAELRAALAGEMPNMGEEYWVKAYHELSRLQVRTVEQNDSLRKENQKLRLSLMMFGDERFEN
jgi:hypothetical protein